MFGIELTAGWIVALVLYFLGGGMMAWADSERPRAHSPRTTFVLVAGWPIVAAIMTTLFLFPSLNRRFNAEADKAAAAKLRREQREKDKRKGPRPPAFGGGA